MSIAQRLRELEIVLPAVAIPAGNYHAYTISNEMVFTTQIAIKDEKIFCPGKLGKELTLAQGYAAAKQVAINLLAVLHIACNGNWDNVQQCVRLDGYIACSEDFTEHPKVLNGASDLLVEVLGERGYHARAAVGVLSLPLNTPVEISAIFKLKG